MRERRHLLPLSSPRTRAGDAAMTCDILNCYEEWTIAECSIAGLLYGAHTNRGGLCGAPFCLSCFVRHSVNHMEPPLNRTA